MLTIVLLLTFPALLYARSLGHDFIYDDHELILEQAAPDSVGAVLAVFAERHWKNLPYYRPVSRVTMVGQKYLHGNWPAPYHAFNIAVSGIGSWVLYRILRQPVFQLPYGIALLGALLLTAHPIASSVVYPICSGRETLLPAVLALGAIDCFLRPGRRAEAGAALFFALALFGKEQAIVIPVIFLAADCLGIAPRTPQGHWQAWLMRYLPLAMIVLLYLGARWMIFGATGEHRLALDERPLGPLYSLIYAWQAIIAPPAELLYEPRRAIWWAPARLLAAAVFAAICIAVLWRQRNTPQFAHASFWLVWLVLGLLPTANIFEQEAQFDERFVFLSLAGAIGLAATITVPHWNAGHSRSVIVMGAIMIMICGVISWHRARYFENDLAFLQQWSRVDPEAHQPRLSLGQLWLAQGKMDAAERQLRRALEIRPDYAAAHSMLALVQLQRGDIEAARGSASRAVKLDPQYAQGHTTLGTVLAAEGELTAAAEHYERALELEPFSVETHTSIANLLAQAGELEAAERQLRQALAINPGYSDAYNSLGIVAARQGRTERAIDHFREALRLRAANAEAHHNLATALASQGRRQEAAYHFVQALRIRRDYPSARRGLEAVTAEPAAPPTP